MTGQAAHFLMVDSAFGEPALRLVCAAGTGAPCRKRHKDPDREAWDADDPDLVDADTCWAVEWVEAAGFPDAVRCDSDARFARVPVDISYDEGVTITPVEPATPTVEQIADAIWASIDDKGIRGRLYREDADYIAAQIVPLLAPTTCSPRPRVVVT